MDSQEIILDFEFGWDHTRVWTPRMTDPSIQKQFLRRVFSLARVHPCQGVKLCVFRPFSSVFKIHFAHCQVLKHDDTLLSDVKGTFDWAAPEQLNMDKCSTSTDVFAYGVVLAEIVTGESPSRRHIRDPK